MSAVFLIVGAVFVGLAAVIHFLIFALESVLWSRPTTWRRFGVHSQEEADVIHPMAYNQGFYNAFLGLGGAAGVIMMCFVDVRGEGIAISLFVLLSMLLAAVVLITSNPRLARAAATQGVAPLIGLIFLVLSLTT